MANQKISLEIEEKNLKLVIFEAEWESVASWRQLLSCIDRLKVSTKILLAVVSISIATIVWLL